jgi:hypothetical protein
MSKHESKLNEKIQQLEAGLSKLTAEKSTLAQKIEALRAERALSVRGLAGGDEKQRKVISEIEAKIAPLALHLEGLDGHLIKDAQAALITAQDELEVIKAEEKAELAAFIAKSDRKEYDRLIKSIPEREAKIISLHHQLCHAIAELQIDLHRDQTGNMFKHFEDSLMSLPGKIPVSVKEKGLRPLFGRGFHLEIVVWPLIETDPEIPGAGPVNPADVARLRLIRSHQALAAEFYEKNK